MYFFLSFIAWFSWDRKIALHEFDASLYIPVSLCSLQVPFKFISLSCARRVVPDLSLPDNVTTIHLFSDDTINQNKLGREEKTGWLHRRRLRRSLFPFPVSSGSFIQGTPIRAYSTSLWEIVWSYAFVVHNVPGVVNRCATVLGYILRWCCTQCAFSIHSSVCISVCM